MTSDPRFRPPTVYEQLVEVAESAGAFLSDDLLDALDDLAQRIERSAQHQREQHDDEG